MSKYLYSDNKEYFNGLARMSYDWRKDQAKKIKLLDKDKFPKVDIEGISSLLNFGADVKIYFLKFYTSKLIYDIIIQAYGKPERELTYYKYDANISKNLIEIMLEFTEQELNSVIDEKYMNSYITDEFIYGSYIKALKEVNKNDQIPLTIDKKYIPKEVPWKANYFFNEYTNIYDLILSLLDYEEMPTMEEILNNSFNGKKRSKIDWFKDQAIRCERLKGCKIKDMDLVAISSMLHDYEWDREVHTEHQCTRYMLDVLRFSILEPELESLYYKYDAINSRMLFQNIIEDDEKAIKMAKRNLNNWYQEALKEFMKNDLYNLISVEIRNTIKFPKKVPWTLDDLITKGLYDLIPLLKIK